MRTQSREASPEGQPREATLRRILRWMLTIFGACAVTFMMLMYALERRGRRFILAFACGCGLSSVYGFLAGTWPFGVVEAIWAGIALRRYLQTSKGASEAAALGSARPLDAAPKPERERVSGRS